MYNFILQTAVVLSLGVIIYLLARAVERSGNVSAPDQSSNAFDKFIAKIPLAKIDAVLNSFFGKFLRKSKVIVMKVDNLLNQYINKLKRGGEEKPNEPLK